MRARTCFCISVDWGRSERHLIKGRLESCTWFGDPEDLTSQWPQGSTPEVSSPEVPIHTTSPTPRGFTLIFFLTVFPPEYPPPLPPQLQVR